MSHVWMSHEWMSHEWISHEWMSHEWMSHEGIQSVMVKSWSIEEHILKLTLQVPTCHNLANVIHEPWIHVPLVFYLIRSPSY